MDTLGMLVALVNVIPIMNSLIERGQTNVIIPEASYARVLSGSTRAAVGDAVVGVPFGYERPPNACCSTFVALSGIDSY